MIDMRIQIVLCKSLRSRLVGLMRYKPVDNVVVCLVPCAAIHTWGMKHSIDVCFCNREMRVIKSVRNVSPYMYLRCKGAVCVVERFAADSQWPKEGDTLSGEVIGMT